MNHILTQKGKKYSRRDAESAEKAKYISVKKSLEGLELTLRLRVLCEDALLIWPVRVSAIRREYERARSKGEKKIV